MPRRMTVLLLVLASYCVAQNTPKPDHRLQPPKVQRNLYPADADAKAEIRQALEEAGRGGQRVLVIFGANWCFDCHVLDNGLHDPEVAPIVEKGFRLVHVDIGRGNKNLDLVRKYQIPLDRGIPALAVLDATGKLLFSQQHGEFESARSLMRNELVAFLVKWQPAAKPSASAQ